MTAYQSIVTRRLTIQDEAAVAGLYGSSDRWMESPVSKEFLDQNLAVARRDYLMGDPTSRILLGTFNADRLVLSGGLFFWHKMPFCTILRLVGKLEAENPVTLTKCMISLFDKSLDELQAKKCTRFYLLTSGHHLSTLAKVGARLPRLRRDYLMTVESVIAPETRPVEEYIWSMMGERTWPVPLVLRAGTAYNHVRTFDKTVVDDEILDAWSTDKRGEKL
ncbi:hypothetical protein BH10BDE1_BH10BDE1_07900 [soil metagenome]